MPITERLEMLTAVKETLTAERNFYIRWQDWPKVTARKYKLKLVDEQIATLKTRLH